MTITGNEPAMPRPYSHDERPSGGFEGDRSETFNAFTGLTIRQYLAALAMQGFLVQCYSIDAKVIALRSVEYVDALIAELNK